ncbi:hypothetical protein ACHAWC_003770, partial [Mediolabrus comicus]
MSLSSMSGSTTKNAVLFCAQIPNNGTRIEISFDSTSSFNDDTNGGGNDSNAATLIVTVADARHDGNTTPQNNTIRKIRLVGKDELSIFLNGKVVLKESMKMPEFTDGSIGGRGGVGSKLAKIGSGFGSFNRSSSSDSSSSPLEITFFSNIEGQAGSLYVFEERVSDETIRALHRETANCIDQTYLTQRLGSLCGDEWDLDERRMCHLAKVISASSLETDLKDSVLPDFPELVGENSSRRRLLFDCVDEDEADDIPLELSRASFGSKLFLVWDPRRVREGQLVDPHTCQNVTIGENVCRWSFESIKDTLGSLGGVQRLIPLFWTTNTESLSKSAAGINEYYEYMIIHSLISLLASFIRDHDINCRELFRCGGVNVVEKFLNDCKKEHDKSKHGNYVVGITPHVAKCNVSALLDLWQASRPVFALEAIVFSRLVFNLPLLLGGVSKCSGVSFHSVLLPVLSELAAQSPEKVRDCVGTRELFELVTEYSNISDESGSEQRGDKKALFFRGVGSAKDPLYLRERIFVIDVIFGIIATILSERCTTQDLYPLITYITSNLDSEWEAASASIKSDKIDSTMATSPYEGSLKAVSILFFLLQKHPPVPNLLDTLTDIFEHGNGVASWMLCCLVNSFDDRIRGLGIKCLAVYLQNVSSGPQNNVVRGLQSTPKNSVSKSTNNTPSGKISNTMRYGMGIANNVLMSVLSGRDNTKVTYKLLWHLLKCHRERLGMVSNAALLYLIVEDRLSSSLQIEDIIVADVDAIGAFRIEYASLLDNHLSKGGTFAIGNSYGVATLLRLLRFMPNDQKERWLFDLLAMTLASSKSVEAILSCDNEWQPCLFHLTAEVIEEITGGNKQSSEGNGERRSAVDTEALSKPSVRTRSILVGMYGIRLDNLVSGINAFEALAGAKVNTEKAVNDRMRKRARHRYVCVVLASQVLTLLDAFIFPDNLDSTQAASQLHGLSLVRSTEPRLGQSQGALLVSLIRLSLILLAYLEPSSVRFLQACSRLRCFLHWSLEIIRESVALGGYSVAFHELTAPLDRMVLVIVLHCHRALSRCSVVLSELESSPWDKYFSDLESRQKSHRRLFRAILELREIVLAAYRGRNEVLRTALSPKAHKALSRGLEEVPTTPQNEGSKSSS